MPNIRGIIRCSVHSAHKALENCLEKEARISDILQKLVTAYGSPGSSEDNGSGGLARAITNSLKLQQLLSEEVARETDKTVSKLRYAKQRFGTIADVCGHLVRHVKPLVRVLSALESDWARSVLAFFSPSNLLLLALVAEFSAAALRFIRSWDGCDGIRGVAKLATSVDMLEGELRHLFAYRDSANNLREPFAMSENFSAGFVQMLHREKHGKQPRKFFLTVQRVT